MHNELDTLRNQLTRGNVEASQAIREARKCILGSLPLLPHIYAVHRDSKNHALACLAYQTILSFDSHAIPFLLELLQSTSSIERCDAISLLVGSCQSESHLLTGYLYARSAVLPDFGVHRPVVLSKLAAATNDAVREVRVRAVVALDDLHATPTEIVGILVDGLESHDAVIRKLASLYLGRLESIAIDALPALRKHVQSWNGVDDGTVYPLRATVTAIWRIENTEPNHEPKWPIGRD